MNEIALLWFRRAMRIEDNSSIAHALNDNKKIIPIFIFDTTVLSRFNNEEDHRLTFIAQTLIAMNQVLKNYNSEMLVFHGDPISIISEIAKSCAIKHVYAEEDLEPANIERDRAVGDRLNKLEAKLYLNLDHLIMHPKDLVKDNGSPYKVFSPFMKKFRQRLEHQPVIEYDYDLKNKFVDLAEIKLKLKNSNIKLVKLTSAEQILEQIGYKLSSKVYWDTNNAYQVLEEFIENKLTTYSSLRSYPAQAGTSQISPFLRFGRLSIRHCFRKAKECEHNFTWINELIWREFYAYIMYHYPHSVTSEFQTVYHNKIPWQKNDDLFKKFIEGKTGFPIVDAAMRQIASIGWMHNRLRMIVASFLTKNLNMDWRLGEEYFAQNLMDYELASNVGGWQWSSSTGADPQPYFRMFNPWLQGKKFDPDASFIKHYVPELKDLNPEEIHDPKKLEADITASTYPKPIIDYYDTRDTTLSLFRSIKGNKEYDI